MGSDAAITYLHDHLAGARAAAELLEHLAQHADDEPLRREAPPLREQIEEERGLLQALVRELGGPERPPMLKEAGAWMGEKLSRLKLGGMSGAVQGLPLFEAVEALVLGIRGKMALWDALATVADADDSFPTRDWEALREEALAQFSRMEEHRLRLARQILAPVRSAREG